MTCCCRPRPWIWSTFMVLPPRLSRLALMPPPDTIFSLGRGIGETAGCSRLRAVEPVPHRGSRDVVEGIVKRETDLEAEVARGVVQDAGFSDGTVKTNAVQILRQAGIEDVKSLRGGHMYLMYVDESGDCGMPADGSPSRFFCLTGVVVHELRWLDTMNQLLGFRRWLKSKYKVYLDDELHAADMVSKPSNTAPSLQRLKKHERLAIIRHFADEIARLSDISLINVVVDKQGKVPNKDEVFRWAWYALFQRFENTIRYQNFPGPKNADDRGIVLPDDTDGGKLRRYLSEMRLKNLLKIQQAHGASFYEDKPIKVIVEDPILRDSRGSYFIQVADCGAFLLKQSIQPSSFMRKHGGSAYFHRLAPVLCKHASNKHPLGIVRL